MSTHQPWNFHKNKQQNIAKEGMRNGVVVWEKESIVLFSPKRLRLETVHGSVNHYLNCCYRRRPLRCRFLRRSNPSHSWVSESELLLMSVFAAGDGRKRERKEKEGERKSVRRPRLIGMRDFRRSVVS